VVMVQRYSACVWPEMMILIDGSSFCTIDRMSLPARLPAQPLGVLTAPVWKPPWWITRIGICTPWRARRFASALAAWASSTNLRPATPAGVTMVGVAWSTSPMKPTPIFLAAGRPLNHLTPEAGKSGLLLALSMTFADRYWKLAPGYVPVEAWPGRAYGAP